MTRTDEFELGVDRAFFARLRGEQRAPVLPTERAKRGLEHLHKIFNGPGRGKNFLDGFIIRGGRGPPDPLQLANIVAVGATTFGTNSPTKTHKTIGAQISP
jgi:hypothetical protein